MNEDEEVGKKLLPEKCGFCGEEAIQMDAQVTEAAECNNCHAPMWVIHVSFSCTNCDAYGQVEGAFHGPDGSESPIEAMRRNAHLN